MSTSAASLALPTLSLRTRQPLSSPPQCFFLNPNNQKPTSSSISATFLRFRPSLLSSSSRFVTCVATSEYQDEETLSDGDDDRRNSNPDSKLFVGNLPFNVDSAQLAELFESAGSVEVVEVIYDKMTGRSRGFGFVTMSSAEEAAAATQQFDGYELDGRPLRVNNGPPPPRSENPRFGGESRGYGGESRGYGGESRGYGNRSPARGGYGGGGGSFSDNGNRVHVGNLAWGVDHLALESLFREQGKVLEAKVIYDRESGRSRGFGFVTYGSAEECSSAIESLDGADLNGRQIRVSLADSKPKPRF